MFDALGHRVFWDPAKAAANFAKHGVSFEEARQAMADPLQKVRNDPEHSVGERRYILFGQSQLDSILIVCFTIRGNFARIISARKATRGERRMYMNDDIIRDRPSDEDEDTMRDDYSDLDGWERDRFHFPILTGEVRLDPDVFDVFRTAEEVNAALRMLIREGRIPHLPATDE